MKTYKPVTSKFTAPCAPYLYNPLFHLEATLTNAARAIINGFDFRRRDTVGKEKPRPIEFDTIACTGVSGLVVAVPLAQRMGRKIVIVRKGGDGTHSANRIEANCFPGEIGKYIIVDDLTDTGKTIENIVAALKTHAPRRTKHVATYLYDTGTLRRP